MEDSKVLYICRDGLTDCTCVRYLFANIYANVGYVTLSSFHACIATATQPDPPTLE